MRCVVKARVLENPSSQACLPGEGACLVVFQVRGEQGLGDGYYSCVEGVDASGNFYQSDEFGPYATADVAEQVALDFFDAFLQESREHASCSLKFFDVQERSKTMILLNFGHPFTTAQLVQIEALAGKQIQRVVDIHTQVDLQQDLVPQVVALVNRAYLTADDWKTADIVVNPPGLSSIAFPLLVEIYGRYGYFPSMLRMRPVANSTPPRYEPAEVVNLQVLCDESRKRRV